jgi:hypothetical protein
LGLSPAQARRGIPQPDVVALPTRLALFDLPDPTTAQPTLALAAASPSGGWQPVAIEILAGGTASASRTAPGEAMLGEALTIFGDGQPFLTDLVNTLDVQLANPDHWLQSRDDEALAMGANLAMVGDEMIQFGRAEALAPGKFRLSRLLRGRRGSEWAVAGHAAGEDFLLLDARAVKAIPLPIELLGSVLTVTAHGPGDVTSPPSVTRAANGEAMKPLSPSHLQAGVAADGSLAVGWVQRSRSAWAWLDEVEASADPAVQGYRLRVSGSVAAIERDSSGAQLSLTAAEVASLGGGPIEIEARQIGATGPSRPATITINP